ncbi:hypothetical protein M2323_004682 [Rhodoblastus acidophilus]|uniref:hypothetical protein n=1 Tax=Rhodoblastus acidophilus TaxID=1074 RepID=UPI0022250B80|nr:hypothetical protein [Rhodoblastus acidophilus]MCW2286882.1 hypothetical protein [Rhodoblastus acidophilus]MCW2335726.1 hypothetical protein [Rhodoblastus acidophilus]
MISKDKIAKVCSHTAHGSHLVYFAAAAFGAHDVYAVVAGVLCFVMVIGYAVNGSLEV